MNQVPPRAGVDAAEKNVQGISDAEIIQLNRVDPKHVEPAEAQTLQKQRHKKNCVIHGNGVED